MALNPNPSLLSQQQIIQRVMDSDNDRLRVDAVVTATIGDLIIKSDESNITIGNPNNGNTLNVHNDGSIDVNVVLDSSTDSITTVQGTSPWTVSGTVTANAGTGTFIVDGSGVTQPVSGTVTVNQGTTPWVVSGGSSSPDVNIHDSAGNTLSATGTSLDVNITNSTLTVNQGTSPWLTSRDWTLLNTTDSVNVGNFPATFDVTQNTSPWVVSGAVTANAGTGTFIVDGSASTQPVSGTVTVNAGTNLNTSALSLESTQSAFKTANHTDLTTINTTLGSPFQAGGSIGNTAFIANAGTNLNTSALNLESTQSAFKTANHTDLSAINTTLGTPMQNSGGTVSVTQGTSPWVISGTSTVSGTIAATQSGAWTTGRTWTTSNSTDSIAAVQSGTWNIGTVTTITNVVHVDDNSGSLTVDNNGTFAVQATLAAETTKVIGTVNIAAAQTIAVTNAGTFATQSTLAAETTKVIGTVNVAASQTIGISAGSAVIGHVIVDTAPSTAVTNVGTFAVQAAEADGANVTLGAKADAKSTATDTTAISVMSVLKQISASVQAPPSQAVTNAGTFATQSTLAAETTKVIGTVNQGTSPWVVGAGTGTLTDRSGTATNTSAQIMAANASRKYLFIQNLGNAPIYINFTSAATVGSGSLELAQFASFVMDSSFVSTEQVNVIRSGGSNLAFTAKEG